ncbi:peptidylprolyl isomerase [Sphingomonas sp.]|uniref:peptidylprolyl isomerase n=1 Tax=Sphingomonas sp. TaxID=28214 RepID=UPI0025EE7DA0|nr:peptidylprolyl isomerase [Sphingomonas sp.]
MRYFALAALALLAAAPKPLTPIDIVAAAPASAWRRIAPEDLLVINFKAGPRVVIQLAPAFAPVHVANIRALARAHWWDGAAIYRVQDNYVVQWGHNDDRKLSAGIVARPPAEYVRPLAGLPVTRFAYRDSYAPRAGYASGWPVAIDRRTASLTHCYAYVGVGRDLAPDTGTGGELYAVIGHAPRQLDRNIAVVGRVIAGIEAMSSLPRGTDALGFYKERSSDVPIASTRLASDLPPADRPDFEVMDTASASFAAYLAKRANRRDDFYRRAAGGVDLCNAPVPVRPVKR